MKKVQASVLLINYNKSKFVSRCLNHLTKQDFKEFEVIFSDDRSEDNSVLVAKKYIYMPFKSAWLNFHVRQYCIYGVFCKNRQ